MFAFLLQSVVFFAAAAEGGSQGGYLETYNRIFNIPGFELWKFINLAIFVAFVIYIGKKKMGPAFIQRREAIRAELIKAEEEKQNALKLLTSAEAKLAGLENEKAEILKKADLEAEAEKRRIVEETQNDIRRLREQVESEVERLEKQIFFRLKQFSANESIRLAEEKLKAQMDQDKDSRLVKSGIASIGGLN